jgi:ubiquinone/menaquinone biosynthesis C-methylase UbiE
VTRQFRQGWQGWDEYAPFYDWENAQTLGRRDVPFWTRLAAQAAGDVLELGCGTGRVSFPLAKSGVDLVGVDRSARMLAGARQRSSRTSRTRGSVSFVRADIRQLPFKRARFSMVLAPYGVLQSLIRERDLIETLESVAHVLKPGGAFGIDLVPDVPKWREYDNKVQLRGRAKGGARLTLVESVRQDRRRRLTTFQQEYIERRGGRESRYRFELTFRTLTIAQLSTRLERAGFRVDAVLGDYHGRPWDARADVWILLAKKG